MKITLIMCTVNREAEVARFLFTLKSQTHTDIELIIVDQNHDDRVARIIEEVNVGFPLIQLKSEPGLSKARNVALPYISGDIVGFPDDDCWYDSTLLQRVDSFFKNYPDCHGLTGRAIDQNGAPVGRFHNRAGTVNWKNAWNRAISISMFLRTDVVREVGCFDEKLGVGSGTAWGSGEETDYLLRALEKGFIIVYDPSLTVFHPSSQLDHSSAFNADKSLSYGRGMGYVLGKHRYPIWYVLLTWVRPFAGAIISLLRGNLPKTMFYMQSLRGRISGWVGARYFIGRGETVTETDEHGL